MSPSSRYDRATSLPSCLPPSLPTSLSTYPTTDPHTYRPTYRPPGHARGARPCERRAHARSEAGARTDGLRAQAAPDNVLGAHVQHQDPRRAAHGCWPPEARGAPRDHGRTARGAARGAARAQTRSRPPVDLVAPRQPSAPAGAPPHMQHAHAACTCTCTCSMPMHTHVPHAPAHADAHAHACSRTRPPRRRPPPRGVAWLTWRSLRALTTSNGDWTTRRLSCATSATCCRQTRRGGCRWRTCTSYSYW